MLSRFLAPFAMTWSLPLTVLAIGSLAVPSAWAQQANSAQSQEFFPGITSVPVGKTPLSGPPSILALEHRAASDMLPQDASVVSAMTADLAQKAKVAQFDLDRDGWEYEQVVCPAFPDYLFLSFSHPSVNHDARDEGSPRFVAVLERDTPWVRVITPHSSGTLPFAIGWSSSGADEVFNHMLRRERGLVPLSSAPAWLSIGMCYAEMTGHRVQVLTTEPQPDPTLDLMRLNGDRPHMQINPNQSVDILFSDVSKPGVTTQWQLHFDRKGQILSSGSSGERQPKTIALKP